MDYKDTITNWLEHLGARLVVGGILGAILGGLVGAIMSGFVPEVGLGSSMFSEPDSLARVFLGGGGVLSMATGTVVGMFSVTLLGVLLSLTEGGLVDRLLMGRWVKDELKLLVYLSVVGGLVGFLAGAMVNWEVLIGFGTLFGLMMAVVTMVIIYQDWRKAK